MRASTLLVFVWGGSLSHTLTEIILYYLYEEKKLLVPRQLKVDLMSLLSEGQKAHHVRIQQPAVLHQLGLNISAPTFRKKPQKREETQNQPIKPHSL